MNAVLSLVRWVILLVVAALALLALIWLTQRRLIYFPTQSLLDPHQLLPGTEEVTFPTEDGLTLAAWFAPATGGESAPSVRASPPDTAGSAHQEAQDSAGAMCGRR